jgi:hypothetical protein
MRDIHTVILKAGIQDDITPDNTDDIAMNFVRDVYGAVDAPTEMVLAVELGRRMSTISRILMACVERLPVGERTSEKVSVEISPREQEACWLIARGDIDVHMPEVQ